MQTAQGAGRKAQGKGIETFILVLTLIFKSGGLWRLSFVPFWTTFWFCVDSPF
jgi:hypothetical protein